MFETASRSDRDGLRIELMLHNLSQGANNSGIATNLQPLPAAGIKAFPSRPHTPHKMFTFIYIKTMDGKALIILQSKPTKCTISKLTLSLLMSYMYGAPSKARNLT
jgi:hypothetical protein